MTEQERNAQRFTGKYLRGDKTVKTVKVKCDELPRISLGTYTHNGKLPKRGGAL